MIIHNTPYHYQPKEKTRPYAYTPNQKKSVGYYIPPQVNIPTETSDPDSFESCGQNNIFESLPNMMRFDEEVSE